MSWKDSPNAVWEPNIVVAGSSCPLGELGPQAKYSDLDHLIEGGGVLSSPSAEESLSFGVGQQSTNYREFQILQYTLMIARVGGHDLIFSGFGDFIAKARIPKDFDPIPNRWSLSANLLPINLSIN